MLKPKHIEKIKASTQKEEAIPPVLKL